jgi:hypothetical protein
MHGRGELKYTNGAIYDGNFKEGKMCGYGRYVFADGAVYEGHWDDEKMNGEVSMTGDRSVDDGFTMCAIMMKRNFLQLSFVLLALHIHNLLSF